MSSFKSLLEIQGKKWVTLIYNLYYIIDTSSVPNMSLKFLENDIKASKYKLNDILTPIQ